MGYCADERRMTMNGGSGVAIGSYARCMVSFINRSVRGIYYEICTKQQSSATSSSVTAIKRAMCPT